MNGIKGYVVRTLAGVADAAGEVARSAICMASRERAFGQSVTVRGLDACACQGMHLCRSWTPSCSACPG